MAPNSKYTRGECTDPHKWMGEEISHRHSGLMHTWKHTPGKADTGNDNNWRPKLDSGKNLWKCPGSVWFMKSDLSKFLSYSEMYHRAMVSVKGPVENLPYMAANSVNVISDRRIHIGSNLANIDYWTIFQPTTNTLWCVSWRSYVKYEMVTVYGLFKSIISFILAAT